MYGVQGSVWKDVHSVTELEVLELRFAFGIFVVRMILLMVPICRGL